MSPGLSGILFALSVALSAAGIVVYFVVLLRRPSVVRLLNGSGLFFSAVALAQVALVIHRAPLGPVYTNLAWAVILLSAAVLVQAAAALRNRKAWDGVERRASDNAAPGKSS